MKDRLLHIKQDQVVFSENDKSKEMYIVQSGKLGVYKKVGMDQTLLCLLGTGDFFGEMSLFDDSPRSATVIAKADSTLIVVTKRNLEQQLAKIPKWFVQLFKILIQRLRMMDRKIETLFLKDNLGQVANVICNLAYLTSNRAYEDDQARLDYDDTVMNATDSLCIKDEEARKALELLEEDDLLDTFMDNSGTRFIKVCSIAELHKYVDFLDLQLCYRGNDLFQGLIKNQKSMYILKAILRVVDHYGEPRHGSYVIDANLLQKQLKQAIMDHVTLPKIMGDLRTLGFIKQLYEQNGVVNVVEKGGLENILLYQNMREKYGEGHSFTASNNNSAPSSQSSNNNSAAVGEKTDWVKDATDEIFTDSQEDWKLEETAGALTDVEDFDDDTKLIFEESEGNDSRLDFTAVEVATRSLHSGQELAFSIIDVTSSLVVFREGMTINERMIAKLKQMQIKSVQIKK